MLGEQLLEPHCRTGLLSWLLLPGPQHHAASAPVRMLLVSVHLPGKKALSLAWLPSYVASFLLPKIGQSSWSGLVSREEAQLPIREKVGLNKC